MAPFWHECRGARQYASLEVLIPMVRASTGFLAGGKFA
jgi:hypothetical protein